MNGKELLYKINDLDDDLIEQADKAKKGRVKPFKIGIALAAAFVLFTMAACVTATLSFKEIYEAGLLHGGEHSKASIETLLEISKNKTVKKDIKETVTIDELYDAFGLAENATHTSHQTYIPSQTGRPNTYVWYYDENGKAVRIGGGYPPTDWYSDIIKVEKNGFLKENENGELYTVFKTESGAYVYCIMKVVGGKTESGGEEAVSIQFDRAYWVYGEILKKEYFEGLKVGETTLSEVCERVGVSQKTKLAANIVSVYNNTTVKHEGTVYAVNSDFIFALDKNAIAITTKMSFLTSEGIAVVTFARDAEAKDLTVSAVDFTEGCPINAEDLVL